MIDLRNVASLPTQKSAAIPVANQVVEVRIDARISTLSVRFSGPSGGKISLDQTLVDNGQLGVKEYSSVSPNEWFRLAVRRDRRAGTTALEKYFVTSESAGSRVEILVQGMP